MKTFDCNKEFFAFYTHSSHSCCSDMKCLVPADGEERGATLRSATTEPEIQATTEQALDVWQ
jgi:hypothetical protein